MLKWSFEIMTRKLENIIAFTPSKNENHSNTELNYLIRDNVLHNFTFVELSYSTPVRLYETYLEQERVFSNCFQCRVILF